MKIKYKKDLPIKNISNLPGGLNCGFLLCIKGEGEDLIAKAWKRKEPKNISPNEVVVLF